MGILFKLVDQLERRPLADGLFLPFQDWCAGNGDYCDKHSIHLLLLLQICLGH